MVDSGLDTSSQHGNAVSPSRLKRPCGNQDSPYEKYKIRIEQQEQQAAEKLAEMEAKLKEMQKLLQVKMSVFNKIPQVRRGLYTVLESGFCSNEHIFLYQASRTK